ncbi:MAG TPA: chemotaxis-specific protein-glutamate methyltransferase CheB, partial [Blastocatellia bacterium]
ATLKPDVITLDLEMEQMDALGFLSKLMKQRPMPVVVVSSAGVCNSKAGLKALKLGATEIVIKPGSADDDSRYAHRYSVRDIVRPLARAIRAAAAANLTQNQSAPTKPKSAAKETPTEYQTPLPKPKPTESNATSSVESSESKVPRSVLAIGASTGGPRAIETLLKGMPATAPGILIVQHMPAGFTAAFAARLNKVCTIEVREAADGDSVLPGVALIAPGNRHLHLDLGGGGYIVRVKNGPAVQFHRPSVDVLFQSVARSAGPHAIGALLTGMGRDGAKGLLAMNRSGAHTLAQDEASSVVFGMPGEAVKMGAATRVVPLSGMCQAILEFLQN